MSGQGRPPEVEQRTRVPPITPTVKVSSGLFGDLPMIARLVTIVGVPGLIALFLVYMGANMLPQIRQDVTLMRVEAGQHQGALLEAIENQRRILRMLQRVCALTAKTDQERTRCFDD